MYQWTWAAARAVSNPTSTWPLVDVMLVLLIIMMLITPMLNQASVRLRSVNSVDKATTQDNTVVAIARTAPVYLNAKPVAEAELPTKINEALEARRPCSSR